MRKTDIRAVPVDVGEEPRVLLIWPATRPPAPLTPHGTTGLFRISEFLQLLNLRTLESWQDLVHLRGPE